MSNIITFSRLSPVKWIKKNFVASARYHTRPFDSFRYPETLYADQDGKPFYRPWQKNDPVKIPLLSNYGPHVVKVLTCEGHLIKTISLDYLPASTDVTGLRYYQGVLSLADLDEGIYQLEMNSGTPVVDSHVSEFFHVREKHEASVLLTYKHNRNDFNIPFEVSGSFDYRAFGGLRNFEPKSEDTLFIDQPANAVLLSSSAYDIETLVLGEYMGSPDYVASDIRHIMRCKEVLIDGVQYSRNDGAQLDPTREDFYGLSGWSLELRKSKASDGIVSESTLELLEGAAVVYNVIDTSGFGNIEQPAGTNIIKIEKLNVNG